MRTPDGTGLADARTILRSGLRTQPPRAGENTTIGLVATNAKLTKVQAAKMAQMAHDGYARAINPVHTPGDGDTIFSLGHRRVGRRRQRLAGRRARGRGDGRRHRPRRHPGHQLAWCAGDPGLEESAVGKKGNKGNRATHGQELRTRSKPERAVWRFLFALFALLPFCPFALLPFALLPCCPLPYTLTSNVARYRSAR